MTQTNVLLTFTRPADTTVYADLDLIANSTTAANVVVPALSNPTQACQDLLRRVVLTHSQNTLTNASWRLWVLNEAPTVTNGDNGALAGVARNSVVGLFDGTSSALTGGGGLAILTPTSGVAPIITAPCWFLLQARAAYAPANAEVFGLNLEICPL
jgi:hypothetical protein